MKKQLSFRAEQPLYRFLQEYAKHEDLTLADFVRKLVVIAFQMYMEAGSLHELRQKRKGGGK